MSFYGQALYEFTKLFHRITVKNSGFTLEEALPDSASAAADFTADERWDKLGFDTGNHWIDLATSNGTDGNIITISHSAPGQAVQTSVGFQSVDKIEEGKEVVELIPGQFFTTAITEHDKAGHLVGEVKTQNYKLPPSVIKFNESDEVSSKDDGALHFSGDEYILLSNSDNVLQFNHKPNGLAEDINNSQGFVKLTDAEEGAIILNTGDYFKTDNITFDSAGHIIGVTPVYFKLPYEEFNKSFDELNEHMSIVKASGLLDKNEEDQYKILVGLDTMETFPDTYLSIVESGRVTDIYQEIEGQDNPTFASIVGVIGNEENKGGYYSIIDSFQTRDTMKPWYSVSDAINTLGNQITSQSNTMAGISGNFQKLKTALIDKGIITEDIFS